MIFKDFPLIGCGKLGWNVMINSREFYPNERRSDLMLALDTISETNKAKIQQNWEYLEICFKAI